MRRRGNCRNLHDRIASGPLRPPHRLGDREHGAAPGADDVAVDEVRRQDPRAGLAKARDQRRARQIGDHVSRLQSAPGRERARRLGARGRLRVQADDDGAAFSRLLEHLDDRGARDLQRLGDVALGEAVGMVRPSDPGDGVVEFRRRRHAVRQSVLGRSAVSSWVPVCLAGLVRRVALTYVTKWRHSSSAFQPAKDERRDPARPRSQPPVGGWTAVIDEFVAGRWRNPHTGDELRVPYKSIAIGDTLEGARPISSRVEAGLRFVVVSDAQTHDALGRRVAKALEALGPVGSNCWTIPTPFMATPTA